MKECTWIETYSGAKFNIDEPEKNFFDIKDIAHALSMNCRYNGHCKRFYSVAEHSYWVSLLVPEGFELEGLLHDGSEAYLTDVPRPWKLLMPEYKQWEARIESAIAKQWGFPHPMSPEVKEVDTRLLMTEGEQLMENIDDWNYGKPYTNFELMCWSPQQAEDKFISRYNELDNR